MAREQGPDYFGQDYPQGEQGVPYGQIFIAVPKATAEIFDDKGNLIKPTNLRRLSAWTDIKGKEREELNKFTALIKENLKKKKRMRAAAVAGGIIVTVAASGYELGPAHGRHVKDYLKWMKRGLRELERRKQ